MPRSSVLLALALIVLGVGGCPGSLEDPDRFVEDSGSGGKSGGAGGKDSGSGGGQSGGAAGTTGGGAAGASSGGGAGSDAGND